MKTIIEKWKNVIDCDGIERINDPLKREVLSILLDNSFEQMKNDFCHSVDQYIRFQNIKPAIASNKIPSFDFDAIPLIRYTVLSTIILSSVLEIQNMLIGTNTSEQRQ